MKNRRKGKRQETKPVKKQKFGIYYFLVFALFFGTAFYLATTKYFMIENIYVEGNNKYPNEEIIASSGIEKGSNLFKINRKNIISDLIDKYEYIQEAKIKIMFPTSVIISIKQAEPFALLKDGEEYLLISDMGRVLERSDKIVNTKMPIVMGMGKENKKEKSEKSEASELSGSSSNEEQKEEASKENKESKENKKEDKALETAYSDQKNGVKKIEPGDYISKENNETMAMLISLIEAFEKTEFTDITKIDISDRLNMKIVYQDRLLIELGSEDNLEYKLNFVKKTKEYKEELYFEGVIDATIPKQLRVREKSIQNYLNESSEPESKKAESEGEKREEENPKESA